MGTGSGSIVMVPASLLRLRRFMGVAGRLKVKPWAQADEILDAFHEMLRERHEDDAFWRGLEDLLDSIARDMEVRLASRPGGVIENEILAEIRSALGRHDRRPGMFRRLSSVLSAPAVAMLLLLGGVAVAGCETRTVLEGGADGSSDVAHEPLPDPPPDPPADPCADMPADIGSTDVPCDPDIEPDADCPHACMTFEQIVEECVPSEPDRCEYIACIRAMHESWRTGLTELFACHPCPVIESMLFCDFRVDCREDPPGSEFDLEEFLGEGREQHEGARGGERAGEAAAEREEGVDGVGVVDRDREVERGALLGEGLAREVDGGRGPGGAPVGDVEPRDGAVRDDVEGGGDRDGAAD